MALVTTLLLLSLMVAMTLAMVIAVSSDSLVTRYYRNFRSSFYAADSGLNVARQYMVDQLVAAVPTGTFAANTQPIASGTQATVQSSVTTQYGS
jgi:Tfp pilus assembly protein PilX